ncbi:hypothetical protein M426DRAFT_7963 [Hypoxylon sp. CI-4A]|nr:hypothetical protein M426DRAFT_7963 [Hypoxylon sp. CI-4A]
MKCEMWWVILAFISSAAPAAATPQHAIASPQLATRDDTPPSPIHAPPPPGKVCSWSVEEIQAGAAAEFSSYSVEEILAVKKQLEDDYKCPPLPANSNQGPPPGDAKLEIETRQNAKEKDPRCVKAIVSETEYEAASPADYSTFALVMVIAFAVATSLI